ncbi:MAG TPA: hypothetical protein VHD55_00505 [Candidatus Paceibacterota bacterium]|nr:hypothetical protein [Candidatus Paceibacterota bacterium]
MPLTAAATLSNQSSLKDVALFAVEILNSLVPVLLVLILVLFLWIGVQYIYRADGENKASTREAILWGLIALFVAFSVWGIVRLACSTLLGTSECSSGSSGGGGNANQAPLNIIPESAR